MPVMNLGLPFRKCELRECTARHDLKKCSACHFAWYCSPLHQRSDWPSHKTSCHHLKSTAAALAAQDAALRARPGSSPFESAQGVFWWVVETRPYMQARFDLVTALLAGGVRNGEAVDAAIEHSFAMLRLCRGDNLGVRGQVPFCLLRRGRDQEAFDFVKWYATTGASETYDWRNTTEPFLDLQGADALESFDGLVDELFHLSLAVAVCVVKMRLLVDLRVLRDEVRRRETTGQDVGDRMALVREDAVGDILLQRRDIVDKEDYTDVIADMEGQVARLFAWVQNKNRFFWPAILDPDEFAGEPLRIFSFGSRNEAILVFRHSWYAFSECVPVVEMVAELARKK